MEWSRFTKPEEIKHDLNGKVCKETLLSIELEEQPAEHWPHFQKEWGSMYKFKLVPVLRLKVVSRYRNTAGALISDYTEELNEKKSILPACGHMRWMVNKFFRERRSELMLPGHWTGKSWSWRGYYAFWLVTADGEDVPVVHSENRRFWSSSRNPRRQFKILSPLERFTNRGHLAYLTGGGLFERMELRRREDEKGGSVVELLFTEGGQTGVLMDTAKTPLATLVYALNDESGWREKLLARTIIALRKELAEETAKAKSWQDDLEDCKDRFTGLHEANGLFFDEAIRRFDSTKAVSRHKAFADFRKLLEAGERRLAIEPLPEWKVKVLLDWLKLDLSKIPSCLK